MVFHLVDAGTNVLGDDRDGSLKDKFIASSTRHSVDVLFIGKEAGHVEHLAKMRSLGGFRGERHDEVFVVEGVEPWACLPLQVQELVQLFLDLLQRWSECSEV